MKMYQETNVSYFIAIPILSIQNFFVLLPHRYRQPSRRVHKASLQCTKQAFPCFVRGALLKTNRREAAKAIAIISSSKVSIRLLKRLAILFSLSWGAGERMDERQSRGRWLQGTEERGTTSGWHHESTLQSQSQIQERLSVTWGKLAICYNIWTSPEVSYDVIISIDP